MLRRFVPLAVCLFAFASALPALGQSAAPQGGAATQGATQQPNSQQTRMAACNSGAATRTLSGDPRKQFMSDCLAGRVPPTPPPAATTGNSQQDKMKTCNAEAGAKKLAGDDRKAFMSNCLRG